MGASSYRDEEVYREPKRRKPIQRTPMEEVISKMTAVEENRKALMQAREGLADAENQFMEAEDELRRSEAEVRREISKLDPESQAMLRAMLKKLNDKDRNSRDDER